MVRQFVLASSRCTVEFGLWVALCSCIAGRYGRYTLAVTTHVWFHRILMMTGRFHIITRSGAIRGHHGRSVVKNKVAAMRVRNIDLIVSLVCLCYNMMCL